MSAVMQPSREERTPSENEVRDALAWETGAQAPESKSTWEWLWEAIQGDFNEERSTGQIAFDAAVSMIPVVDQICDLRDLIANCRAIAASSPGDDNTWKWVALVLTLIGLIPGLGSLVKGVLKIFFNFVRRYGIDQLARAVDEAMTWVITFLRKKEVQDYLNSLRVDDVSTWLADQVRAVRSRVSPQTIRQAFDRAISVLEDLLGKVTWLPAIGRRARQCLDTVRSVRRQADEAIGRTMGMVDQILGRIVWRLNYESALQHRAIFNTHNVHFRGALPESRAVTLMRTADPRPIWLSPGRNGSWPEQSVARGRQLVESKKRDGWCDLSETNIKSFHAMAAVEIRGPAKLYRVTSPSNGAMGDCWIPEDVWLKVMNSPDPKAAWRKHLAVWPDWNPNGQFVVMEVPPGQTLKVWRGPAASQTKLDHPDLDAHLQGGWDQIVFKVSGEEFDTTRYYMRGGGHGERLHPPGLSRQEWEQLSESKRAAYTPIRENINHPGIRGPFDTGWGSTDFDAQLRDARIGLPELPGQITNR